MKTSATLVVATSVAMALGFAFPAAAADGATPAESSSKTAIDRETGRLRAITAEEDRELARDAERLKRERRVVTAPGVAALVRPATEAEALQTQVSHADGSVSMMVPESLDSQLVVTRTADGQLVVSHGEAKGDDHDHE